MHRQASTTAALLSRLELAGVDDNQPRRAMRGQEHDGNRSRQATEGREPEGHRLRRATQAVPEEHLLHLAGHAVAEEEAWAEWTRMRLQHFTAALEAWARDEHNRMGVDGNLCRWAVVVGETLGSTSPTACRVVKGPAGADAEAQ